ncbi:MAG: hypothetical protein ABII93_04120 [Chrysiogenia bacterium]
MKVSVEQNCPDLSVILIVGEQRRRAGACLASLLDQRVLTRLEILLFDMARPGISPLLGSDHSQVRQIDAGRDWTFGRIRTEGVRQAKSPLVAFIEEHCLVGPNWGEEVLKAHQERWVGVGAEILPANPGMGISDAVWLLSFGPWAPPAQAGKTDQLPGNNSSYRRDILLAYDADLPVLLRTDTVLQWRLVLDGHPLCIEPAVKVSHRNEGELKSIRRGFYLWHRLFAHTRAEVFQWKGWRKGFRLLTLPLFPFYRTLKLWRFCRSRHPRLGVIIWRHIAAVFLTYLSAAAGLAAGWLKGLGDAEREFLLYEINEERPGNDHPSL